MTLIRICWLINAITLGLIVLSFYTSYVTLPAEAQSNTDVQMYWGMWMLGVIFFGTGFMVSYFLYRNGWVTAAKVLAVIPAGFATALVVISLGFVLLFIFGSPSH